MFVKNEGIVKRLFDVMLFPGDKYNAHSLLSDLCAFVDHVIRLFTALGFLTGLLNLRSLYPDNDLILVLLLILGAAVLFYSSYLFDYVTVSALQIVPYFKRNRLARRIVATVIGLTYIVAIFINVATITAFLSEIKPFG